MKAASKRSAQAPKRLTCKVNLTLGTDQYKRLFVTSVMAGKTASAIVEELIDSGLKTWALPANLTARAEKSNRVDISASESESENKAA